MLEVHMDKPQRQHHHQEQASKGGETVGQQTVNKFGTVLSASYLARYKY